MLKDFKVRVKGKEVIITYMNTDIDIFIRFVQGYNQKVDEDVLDDLKSGKTAFGIFNINDTITIYTNIEEFPFCYFVRASIIAATFAATKYKMEDATIEIASDLIGLGVIQLYDYDDIKETATETALKWSDAEVEGIDIDEFNFNLN